MNLLQQFEKYISEENLFTKEDHLLVAVSGGMDSAVLCDLCYKSGYRFSMAHCNFQLRDQESDEDEAFVRELAEKYGVRFFTKKFDTQQVAAEHKTGIQETARDLRYAWFYQLLAEEYFSGSATAIHIPGWHTGEGRGCILTAHHANDNIETVLMNFFKGTGLNGIQGIMPKHGMGGIICRPLLFAPKKDIVTYAKEHGVSFREDSSNLSDKYTRNYVRNQLLPAIKKIFPEAEKSILDNIRKFKEVNFIYRQSIENAKKKLLFSKGDEVHIPVLKLAKLPFLQSMLYEILHEYHFTPGQVGQVIQLLDSGTGKFVNSSSHRILRNRNWLIISPLDTAEPGIIIIDETDTEVIFPQGTLLLAKNTVHAIDPNPLVARLDTTGITYPLLLRKWKTGDYFYPLGMQKKKKLSRFFIDSKLSLTEKEHTWVIESNKKILWVVGKRIDDRFKIKESTKEVVQFTFVTQD